MLLNWTKNCPRHEIFNEGNETCSNLVLKKFVSIDLSHLLTMTCCQKILSLTDEYRKYPLSKSHEFGTIVYVLLNLRILYTFEWVPIKFFCSFLFAFIYFFASQEVEVLLIEFVNNAINVCCGICCCCTRQNVL